MYIDTMVAQGEKRPQLIGTQRAVVSSQSPSKRKNQLMNIISQSVLIESRSARSNMLAITSSERSLEVLHKAKAIIMATWQGENYATTAELANYYEVAESTIKDIYRLNKLEFEADGVKTLAGQELRDARRVVRLPSKTSQALIWTSRSALRLGFLLTQSAVASEVRTQALSLIEQIPAAHKIIDEQAERIKQMELQLAVFQAEADAAKQKRLLGEFNHSVLTLHDTSTLALIQGRPEAIVERVTEVSETVLCTEDGTPIVHTKGITKTAMAKRYGMKKAENFVSWLDSTGKRNLLIDGVTAVPCQYISHRDVKELDALWADKKGDRQRLIGE